MVSTNRTARTAGLIYLIVVVTGIFSLAYVPSQLVVSDDAAKTVANISASQGLFRLGIAVGFVCHVAFLVLPLQLYGLFSHVNRNAAALMVCLAIASVPLSLGNLANKLDVLTLLGGKSYLAGYAPDQLGAMVMLCLAKYGNGLLIAEIFWGLWLFPFGYLVFRSGMLPKILGILLMAGCCGYLIDVLGTVLFASYASSDLAQFATVPAAVGEIGTCLWLLLFGARNQSPSLSQAFAQTSSGVAD